jgi:hypothetical protein
MTRTMTRAPLAKKPAPKPASNVYTVMLVVAFAFIVTAIVLNVVNLVTKYDVDVMKALIPF